MQQKNKENALNREKLLSNLKIKKENSLSTKLEAKLEQSVGTLLSEEQLEQVVVNVVRVVTEEAFSGPIAHPKHMREYEKILPGSAERIFSMAEAAQTHNQSMDKTFLDASLKVSLRGTHLGFAILVLLIFCATYVGMNGNNILAGILLGAGLVGGAAKLIHGRDKDNKTEASDE